MPLTHRSRTFAFTSAPVAIASLACFVGWGCAPDPGTEPTPESPVAEEDSPVGSGTVAQATADGCSTAAISALSQQIIDEMRCLEPDGLAEAPQRPNLQLQAAVLPYIQVAARDALAAALDAKPSQTMQVSSMFRTVAQQVMIRRWYEQGRCGIAAAAQPGRSSHETGLAVDVTNDSVWRATLESSGFHWFGSGDRNHFDFDGPGADDQRGVDVEAFQRLWNRNNPGDLIAEDGVYGPQTRARIERSPAVGFPVASTCGGASDPPGEEDPTDEPADEPTDLPCDDFPASGEAACTPDGFGRGRCTNAVVEQQPCANGCLIQAGDDVCMTDDDSWTCTGTTGKTKMKNGEYVATAFGCGVLENGEVVSDSGDNCIPACFNWLKQNGVCGSSMSGPQCERQINWYAADRDRFGCGARLRVTNKATGKSAVLMVIDAGPACWVEKKVDTGVLDMSYRASEYLFGESVGWGDGEDVHVVEVASDTPLGPVE